MFAKHFGVNFSFDVYQCMHIMTEVIVLGSMTEGRAAVAGVATGEEARADG